MGSGLRDDGGAAVSRDVTKLFEGKRGQEFIDGIRAMAIMVADQGGSVRCGFCRAERAAYVGMQRCGAPGGPCCAGCLQRQREWMDTAEAIAEASPYCRHCDQDADRDHICAVDLYNASAPEVVM